MRNLIRRDHGHLSRFRVRGEWFDFGDADPVDTIAEALQQLGSRARAEGGDFAADRLPGSAVLRGPDHGGGGADRDRPDHGDGLDRLAPVAAHAVWRSSTGQAAAWRAHCLSGDMFQSREGLAMWTTMKATTGRRQKGWIALSCQ
ncbi:hypothetical protein ACWD5V_24110 [Streptomyces sp. NPDC002523]